MKTMKKIMVLSVLALSMGMAFAAVTENEAIDIALRDAGIGREDAEWLNANRDRDDGRTYYDIEFRSNAGKWEYEIDSETGNIVGFDFEESRNSVSFSDGVDRAEAESIALSDAGFNRNDVSRFRIETDRDDGRMVYEISFNTADAEYEYEINEADGTILKASWEMIGRVSGDRNARLDQKTAKEIAVKALGGKADNISVWEDRDDGRYWYEANAMIGDYRYEVDIAGNGDVVSISRSYRGFWN